MQFFSTFLLTLGTASVVWTSPAPAPEAAAEAAAAAAALERVNTFEKRDTSAFLWKDANYGGDYIALYGLGGTCYNMPGYFNDVASSVNVSPHLSCTFYTDALCKGRRQGFGAPGNEYFASNLMAFNFNDVISSYQCYVYPGA